MKKWIIPTALALLVVWVVAAISPWLSKKADERSPVFLPGVYVCVAENEFYRIDDTLVIRRVREEDDYLVKRGTRVVRIVDGKKEAAEFQQKQWQAHLMSVKYWLISANERDTVCFYPERNIVSKAFFYYEKIE